LRRGDFAPWQKHSRRDAGNSSIGGQRSRGIASGSTSNGANRFFIGHHLPYHGDQHRHPQIFEGARVAVARQLDPQIGHTDLFPKPFCPDTVGVPLIHGDDVVVLHLRADPLFPTPRTAAVGPLVGPYRAGKELPPLGGAAILECSNSCSTFSKPQQSSQ